MPCSDKDLKMESGQVKNCVIIVGCRCEPFYYEEQPRVGTRVLTYIFQTGLHKVYYDETGFEYKIVLTRLDKSSDGKIKSEKYTLFVCSSPFLHLFYQKPD